MAKLKPCPFCGAAPPYEEVSFETDQGMKWGHVVCNPCRVSGPEVRTNYDGWREWASEAVAKWNTRKEPSDE